MEQAVQPLAYDVPLETDDDAFLAALPRTEPHERTPGALAALENARFAVEHDPVRIAAESEERQWSRRLWRAVVLSPNLEICEAIMRGEKVPRVRLDLRWLRRFQRPR